MNERKKLTDSNIIDLSIQCARLLVEKKADDIRLLDLTGVNSYLDYFLITTGNSRIHCRSLARELQKFAGTIGMRERNKPDYDSGWIILDYSELIVHIFTREMREYYQLEKLWGDARIISY